MLIRKIFLVLIMLFCLSSCLSPVNDNSNKYLLSNTCNSYCGHQTHRSILVMPVKSNTIYNTTLMAYTNQPHQVAYFAKNRWADTPGSMLQELMTQALQDSHYFRAVGTFPTTGKYDYMLTTQLVELRQVFYGTNSVVVLTINAQLINANTGFIVGSRQFSMTQPAPQNSPYGGVIAANYATNNFLRQLVSFCVNKY
jgi:cholesterol transport system auxiliary component